MEHPKVLGIAIETILSEVAQKTEWIDTLIAKHKDEIICLNNKRSVYNDKVLKPIINCHY